MSRRELAEWIVILIIIVSWWPRIFWGYGLNYDPMWYHILIHYLAPLVLIVIVLRRWRRVQEGFEYSEEMLKHQRSGKPPGHGDNGRGKGAGTPAIPFMPPSDDDPDNN